MNLVKLATELEYVPKDQLAQMSQDPNASYPPYLVLAEIQRRTQNEKAYAAAQPKPTSTVAEEVVGEFVQPKGLQAGMPSESAPTDAFSSESMGMPASAPMQMASGGLIGYANRGKTKVGPPKPISPESVLKETQDEIKNVSRRTQTFLPKYDLYKKLYMQGIIDEEEFRKALQTETDTLILGSKLNAFTPQWGHGKDIYRSNDSLQAARDASRNEMRQRQMGMASGGLTAYANGGSLDQSFDDPYANVLGSSTNPYPESNAPKTASDLGDAVFEFMYGDEFGDEAMDYIASIPVGGLGIQALRKTLPFIPKAYKGIKNYFSRPKKNPSGRLTTDEAYGGTGYRNIIKPITENPITSAATITPILAGINKLTGQPEPTKTKDKDKDKDKDKLLDELRDKATGTAKPKREIDYDLVGLGGLIMGSRNMSELGMGLAGLAERKQAREDALLEGQAKDDYYKANTEKIRAELENLPLEQKFDILDNITETLKQAREGEIELTDERKLELNQASQLLTSQILALQGIDANSLTGLDVDKALGPKIN